MTSAAPPRGPVVVIVDDDADLRASLAALLAENGFAPVAVPDSAGFFAAAAAGPVDLALIDLRLAGESGQTLAIRIRETMGLPIVMLTGRGDETDKIIGLETGADDYMMKPFNPRELVARIHAVLRRRAAPPPAGAPAPVHEVVRFGKVAVNLATRELTREDAVTLLTTGEFGLLAVLLKHPRQPLSRDKLMELARGREHGVFDRAIDVQISRLRKLVEDDPAKPRYLQTVWGFGYVFVPDGDKHPA